MKVSKALLCQHGALIAALNLAIGKNGIKLWQFMSEVGKVVEPFDKFREKITSDLGLNAETPPGSEKFVEAEKQLNEFVKGEVEIDNVHFLSEDEFVKAASPLFENASYLPMSGINVLRDILCLEEENERQED